MSDKYGLTSERICAMLMDSRTWSTDQMRRFQFSQLEQLVRHAKLQCPFYATRLDCLFDKDGAIDWSRWNDVPILSRDDIRAHGDQIRAASLPVGHGGAKEFRTSGSTGAPISVFTSNLHGIVNTAAGRRAYRLHGIAAEAKLAFTRDVFPDGKVVNEDDRHWIGHGADGQRPLFIKRSLPAERRLELLEEFKTDVLIDFPNDIEVLARHNLLRSKPLRLSHVVGYGMGFSDLQRNLNMESFGAATVATYNSKEGGAMAFQCPDSQAYHVNTECVLLEKVQGVQGIVITPFFQAAQPLIRYQQQDEMNLSENCNCGHPHLSIQNIQGRTDAIFVFPDNKSVSPSSHSISRCAIYKFAFAIQVAQTSSDSIEIRYVANQEASDPMKSEITDVVLKAWHPALKVNFQKLHEIPRNSGGKQQQFIREFLP